MNQKGSLRDLILIIVAVFGLSVALFVGGKVYLGFRDTAQFNNSTAFEQAAGSSLGVFNTAIIFLLVGMVVASVVLAARIPANPIFLPISLILLVMVILIGTIMSNVFVEFAEVPAMQEVVNFLPQVTWVMKNMHIVMGVAGFVLVVAMYSTSGGKERRAR